jgi:hypothetical protein
MIALGIVLTRTRMISLKHVLGALEEMLKHKKDLFLLNKSALDKGYSVHG